MTEDFEELLSVGNLVSDEVKSFSTDTVESVDSCLLHSAQSEGSANISPEEKSKQLHDFENRNINCKKDNSRRLENGSN